jgi:hypothetical protein
LPVRLRGRRGLRKEVLLLEVIFPALPGLRARHSQMRARTARALATDDRVPQSPSKALLREGGIQRLVRFPLLDREGALLVEFLVGLRLVRGGRTLLVGVRFQLRPGWALWRGDSFFSCHEPVQGNDTKGYGVMAMTLLELSKRRGIKTVERALESENVVASTFVEGSALLACRDLQGLLLLI